MFFFVFFFLFFFVYGSRVLDVLFLCLQESLSFLESEGFLFVILFLCFFVFLFLCFFVSLFLYLFIYFYLLLFTFIFIFIFFLFFLTFFFLSFFLVVVQVVKDFCEEINEGKRSWLDLFFEVVLFSLSLFSTSSFLFLFSFPPPLFLHKRTARNTSFTGSFLCLGWH